MLMVYMHDCHARGLRPKTMKSYEQTLRLFGVWIADAHYSFEPIEKWFDELGEYIQYMHLSDNMGKFDDHLPIGSGNIDWEKVNGLWKSLGRDMPATLEVGGIAGVEESLRYLRTKGCFGMEG